jgi:hypothetical protein
MNLEPHIESQTEQASADLVVRPLISEWIWHSWYAKLWWALVPIYWFGAALALKISALDAFYSSALAGFVNVFMFPPTVLVILAAGYIRARFEPIDWSNLQPIDSDELGSWRRGPSGLPPEIDPLDPKSGAFWIGSPTNPANKRKHFR